VLDQATGVDTEAVEGFAYCWRGARSVGVTEAPELIDAITTTLHANGPAAL
jgi:hypothetical protein